MRQLGSNPGHDEGCYPWLTTGIYILVTACLWLALLYEASQLRT